MINYNNQREYEDRQIIFGAVIKSLEKAKKEVEKEKERGKENE